MTTDPVSVTHIIAVVLLMNGNPMNPLSGGAVAMPREPDYPNRKECMAVLVERYSGALDARRGVIVCVPK